MRVAFVSSDPGVPVFGSKGCSVHVQEMLRFFLNELEASITVVTPRIGGEPPGDLSRVDVRQLEIQGDSTRDRERCLIRMNNEVRSILRSEGPFDFVYERYALFAHAGMAYARESSTPGVLEVNAPLIEEQALHRRLVHAGEAEKATRRAFDHASTIVAVSDGVASYARSLCRSKEKIHVVANGVDAQRFRPDIQAIMPGDDGSFTVGFVGTLKPWHGLSDLVEAFCILHAEVPAARLLVVGDGPERSKMEADLARARVLDAVHFAGSVCHEEVPGWLASVDVAVAPYPETLDCYFSPLKIFEYMAAGVPAVATAIGQLPQLIEDGVDGILVNPGRPQELSSALAALHADRSRLASMGRVARDKALARHTWSSVGHRIMKLSGLRAGSREVTA